MGTHITINDGKVEKAEYTPDEEEGAKDLGVQGAEEEPESESSAPGACEALIEKSYVGELKADDDDENVFTAIISTQDIDRDNEVIVAKGISFENFLKDPVVLWAHDHHTPAIGNAMNIRARGKKIIARVRMAPTEFAKEIFSLIKGGFLRAVSIGFDPFKDRDFGPPTDAEIKKNPDLAGVSRIFRKVDLLEFSVVNVPSNPEALITAVGKGEINLSPETAKAMGIDMDKPEQSIERIMQAQRLQFAKRTQVAIRKSVVERIMTDEQIAHAVHQELEHRRGRMVEI